MSLDSLKELLGRRTPGPWVHGNGSDASEFGIWRGKWFGLIARTHSLAEDAAAIVALSNAADELVAVAQVLEEVEWRGGYVESTGPFPGEFKLGRCCPWCSCLPDIHGEDCRLGNALSALNDALEGEE